MKRCVANPRPTGTRVPTITAESKGSCASKIGNENDCPTCENLHANKLARRSPKKGLEPSRSGKGTEISL